MRHTFKHLTPDILRSELPPMIWSRVLHLFDDSIEAYRDNLWNEGCMETQNDIADLYAYLSNAFNMDEPETLDGLCRITEFHKAACGTIPFNEFKNIPTIAEFRDRYPNLAETIQVWVWS